MTIDDHGQSNVVSVGRDSDVVGRVSFYGNHHRLSIGDNTMLRRCSIQFEGVGCSLIIGDGTVAWEFFSVYVSGDGGRVSIGSQCLIGSNVKMRNCDGHALLDRETGTLLNPNRDLVVEDHVWVCDDVHLLKGSLIRHDSVVGAKALVTRRDFPAYSLIAGIPAKVIREGIGWRA